MLGGVDGPAEAMTHQSRAPISEPDQPTRTLRHAEGHDLEPHAPPPISPQAPRLQHLRLDLVSFQGGRTLVGPIGMGLRPRRIALRAVRRRVGPSARHS